MEQINLDWRTGQIQELIVKGGWLGKTSYKLPLSAIDLVSTHGLKLNLTAQELREENQAQVSFS